MDVQDSGKDLSAKSATEKAMALLLHKDRTAQELRDRLFRAGYGEEAVRVAIDYVRQYGYIDDERYAASYIDYHRESMSLREIRQKLRGRGIEEDILDRAFGQFDDDDHTEDLALQKLVEKRLRGRTVGELTYEEKQKEMRYLAGKGFPSEKIRRLFS